MSRKINYKSISPFHDRLYSIIGDDIQGWARRLDVTPATISNRWYKGSYPTTDKIIKLCEISGISATWLIEGSDQATDAQSPDDSTAFLKSCLDDILRDANDHTIDTLRTCLVAFRQSVIKAKEYKDKDDRLSALEGECVDLKRKVDYLCGLCDAKTQSGT